MMYNKWIVFISVLLLSFSSVHAQKFSGGLMAGLVASQVAGDRQSGFNKAGLFAGGFINLDITPRSAFQMELEYFQKGARQNPKPEKDQHDTYILRLNYIELPVLYQFKASKTIKVEAGPSAGFLVGYHEEVNADVISDDQGYNKPAPVTLQINVGIYIYFLEQLAVNVRTNNSILNIRTENRSGDVYRFFDWGQYNDALVISVFYTFRKKGQ